MASKQRFQGDNSRLVVLSKNAGYNIFNAFLSDLDPRGDSDESAALHLALAASSDKRFQAFLKLLYQRRSARWSLAKIAAACDITLAEFQAFWMNAELQRAVYEAACSTARHCGRHDNRRS